MREPLQGGRRVKKKNNERNKEKERERERNTEKYREIQREKYREKKIYFLRGAFFHNYGIKIGDLLLNFY